MTADTTIQRCVDVKGSAAGVGDWGGGPSFQEWQWEGVFKLQGDHAPQTPGQGLFRCTGKEGLPDSGTSERRNVVFILDVKQ